MKKIIIQGEKTSQLAEKPQISGEEFIVVQDGNENKKVKAKNLAMRNPEAKVCVVQERGNSQTDVMSQDAVTRELGEQDEKLRTLNNSLSSFPRETLQVIIPKNDYEQIVVSNNGSVSSSGNRISTKIEIGNIIEFGIKDNLYSYWLRVFDADGGFLGNISESHMGATKRIIPQEEIYSTYPSASYVYAVVRADSNNPIQVGSIEPLYIAKKGDFTIDKYGIYSYTEKKLSLENGGLQPNGQMDTIAEREVFFKKKRTKNFIVFRKFRLNLEGCKAKVFYYDNDFRLITSSDYTKDIANPKNTSFFKLQFTIDDESVLNIQFYISFYEEIKNEYLSESEISFVYQVQISNGRDIINSDSVTEQIVKEKYYNGGLLKLPPNYKNSGEPVPLIIFCHSSGDYGTLTNTVMSNSYKTYIEYLQKEGYAIFDCYGMSNKYYDEPPIMYQPNALGSPTNLACLIQGYNWVVEHYNIENSGVYVTGKSLGGIACMALMFQSSIRIKACCPLAPELDARQIHFGYDAKTRRQYCEDMGFVKFDKIIGTSQQSEMSKKDFDEILNANKSQIAGYLPILSNIVNGNIDDYLTKLQTDNVFKIAKRINHVPIKIFVAKDDAIVRYDGSLNFVQSLKNMGGNAEIRTMPNGTGGHHSVDNDEKALKINIVTKLGYKCENVPLAYAEMVQFFRRF